MKSAYEIAMRRLEEDRPTVALTDAQKEAIAEVERTFQAKVAERKLFLEDKIQKAAGDRDAMEQLQKQLASEMCRLEEEREAKKAGIREGRLEGI